MSRIVPPILGEVSPILSLSPDWDPDGSMEASIEVLSDLKVIPEGNEATEEAILEVTTNNSRRATRI